MVSLLRGLAALFCFALFSIGGFILSLILLLPLSKKSALKLVAFIWKGLALLFWILGLGCYNLTRLKQVKGSVIVANHPSLIDVVLLTAFLPNTFSAAKHVLRKNPFFGRVVRSVFLSDDQHLLEEAGPLLAAGYNVLIFPEGTRSPATGCNPFKLGAAQLALRTGAPIQPIRIEMSERILAKDQPIWRIGAQRIRCTFTSLEPIQPIVKEGQSLHQAASEITRTLHQILSVK